MHTFVDAVRRGFSGLLRFSGRDPARRFWPYAGVVVGLVMASTMAVMVPTMNTMFARMERFAVEHPEQATVTRGASSYAIEIRGDHPEFMPDMTPFFTVVRLGVGLAVLLLAAAVTRRLHDRGRRGWWGLPPVLFLVIGLTLFPRLFHSATQGEMGPETLKLFGLLFANNLLYLGSLALLVVMLVGASQKDENRYGPPEA